MGRVVSLSQQLWLEGARKGGGGGGEAPGIGQRLSHHLFTLRC